MLKTVVLLGLVAVALGSIIPEYDVKSCGCDVDGINIALCGTDGITYDGPCELDCKNSYLERYFNKGVHLFRVGKCEDKDYTVESESARVKLADLEQ